MLQVSTTQRIPERTLVNRVCDELAALGCVRVWARGDGRHVLLGLNAGEAFARLTSLGGGSYGLAFLHASGGGGGSCGEAAKPSAHKWELLLIDDLPAVVEHALIGADALPSD
jgi:hypothetical protein